MKKPLILLFGLAFCCTSLAHLTFSNRYSGISGVLLKNVTSRLQVKEKNISKNLTLAAIKDFYAVAPQEIKKALEPYGYFKSTISATLRHHKNHWYAIYYINPGSRLKITHVNITISGPAQNDPLFKKFRAKFPLKAGDPLVTPIYLKQKEILFTLALKHGYLAAKMVQSEIKIDLKRYNAIINIHFASGPRYYFGKILFEGSKSTTKFLQRFLTFKEGQYFSGAKLEKTQENFNDSDLFSNVMISQYPEKAQNLRVPIVFHLTPRFSREYNFGLGYGTDTGMRGLLAMKLYNITKTGHHFDGVVRASQKESNFEVHYIIPGRHPATDQYDLSVASDIEDEDYGHSYKIVGGVGYSAVFYGWKQTLRLDMQTEWDKWKHQVPALRQRFTYLVPNATWLRRVANDPIRPTKGYRIYVSVQGSVKNMLSNATFLRILVQGKIIQPIYRHATLLVMRGALGYTTTDSRDKLPFSLWFAAGGPQTIRGYGYKKIGPGPKEAIGSIELRQKIFGNWYVAGFVDSGSVAEKMFSHIKTAVGGGIVWLSPIGAIQVSYARKKIQFTMGAEL